MMKKSIPIGRSNFKEIQEMNCYFVDKTLLIQDFLEGNSKVTLVTRPRRFGKTLNMSMLSEFFDITKDSKELFIGTKIMDSPYASQINQYPTIFISFADAKENCKSVVRFIKDQLQMEYARYSFIFENMSEYEENDYLKMKTGIKNGDNGTLEDVEKALVFLIRRLKGYYHKNVMLFIDEYDTPFIEAKVNGFYNEIKGSLTTLLRTSLKNSNDLALAMLTGIQRVAKENIFSDLNNITVCDVTSKKYSSYFGFTESETKELLEYYDLELTEEVKDMYDGYHIGNNEIYNPWSILNYIDNGELIPYWVNTSANKMIKNALNEVDSNFKMDFEKLIKNNYVETEIQLQTSFYEVSNTANLWGLFVNAGYLTIDQNIDISNNIYRIRIPNNEVRKEFISFTEYFLSINEGSLNRVKRALIQEQKDNFIQEYKNILMIPSYHDLKNENSYHMMMLGMSICLNDQYDILSNREEGKSRCDLIFKAKKVNQTSFVLEFKYLKETPKDIQSSLEALANQAIQQIKDNHYDYELVGKVIYIGLAHHIKDVVINWEERIE